jgi:hypothetical protein
MSMVVSPNQYAELEVNIDAPQQVTYQWYRDGNPIDGATSYRLNVSQNQGTDLSGTYHVIISSDGFDDVSSRHATVTQLVPTGGGDWYISSHPQHFALVPGQSRSFDLNVHNPRNTPLTYQWYRNGEAVPLATSRHYSVSAEPVNAGTYHAVVSDGTRSETSATSEVWVGLRQDQPLIVQTSGNQILSLSEYRNLGISLRANTALDAIIWRLDGIVIPQFTSTSISIPRTPEAAGTYTVDVIYQGEAHSSAPMTVTHLEAATALRITRHPVSMALKPGQNANLSIATNLNAQVQWFKDGIPVPLANNNNYLYLNNLTAAHAGTYTARVTYGDEVLTSEEAVLIVRPDEAPVITAQPADVVRPAHGYSPRLYINVRGIPFPHIQWYHDGEPIRNGNSDTYYIEHGTPAGDYHAVVTNRAGSVTSDVVQVSHLSAIDPPRITNHPQDIHPEVGDHVEIRLTATGGAPLSYTWFFGSQIINGIEGSAYIIESVSADHQGRYYVRVSNNSGVTYSRSARLDVGSLPPPSIVAQSSDRVVDPGATTLFSVSAIGPGLLSYQWQRNGVDLFGQTSATLTLTDIGSQHLGLYTVIVTNAGGSVTSQPARLELTPSTHAAIARHRVVGTGYVAGDMVVIAVRISYSGSLSALGYQVLLPDGWAFDNDNLDGTTTAPVGSDTDLLEWSWASVPASPIEFTFNLVVPEGTTGSHEIAGLVESRAGGEAYPALAKPDPLVVEPASDHHSADTNRNGRFGLSELLRVIELYNTRHGSSRTGRYVIQADTVDGYGTDASQPGSVENLLVRPHHADTDRNGHLSLSELLRVIELYNHRTGTTRTGAYRRASGTVDGFEAGN